MVFKEIFEEMLNKKAFRAVEPGEVADNLVYQVAPQSRKEFDKVLADLARRHGGSIQAIGPDGKPDHFYAGNVITEVLREKADVIFPELVTAPIAAEPELVTAGLKRIAKRKIAADLKDDRGDIIGSIEGIDIRTVEFNKDRVFQVTDVLLALQDAGAIPTEFRGDVVNLIGGTGGPGWRWKTNFRTALRNYTSNYPEDPEVWQKGPKSDWLIKGSFLNEHLASILAVAAIDFIDPNDPAKTFRPFGHPSEAPEPSFKYEKAELEKREQALSRGRRIRREPPKPKPEGAPSTGVSIKQTGTENEFIITSSRLSNKIIEPLYMGILAVKSLLKGKFGENVIREIEEGNLSYKTMKKIMTPGTQFEKFIAALDKADLKAKAVSEGAMYNFELKKSETETGLIVKVIKEGDDPKLGLSMIEKVLDNYLETL